MELTVLLARRQVAHTHNLGIESLLFNGFEHQFLSLIFRIDVLVGIDILPDIERLLRQLHLWSGLSVNTQTGNAVGGNMDEPRTGAQTERDQVTYGLDVDHLDVVACREVLHVGHTVDHRQLIVDAVEGFRLGNLCGESSDALIEISEIFKIVEV